MNPGTFNRTTNRGTVTCSLCERRRQRAKMASGFTPPICWDCYVAESLLNEHGSGAHEPEVDGPHAQCRDCKRHQEG